MSAALAATAVGLILLGASSLGFGILRALGFSLLCVGGGIAAATRWRRRRTDVDGEALQQLAIAAAELEGGDPTAAAAAAAKAVKVAGTTRTRNRALTVLAWAALGQGYAERAKAVLERVQPSHALDVHCLAAVEAARGRPEFAIQALELARTAGGLNTEAAKLFVECHLHAFGIERAVVAAMQVRSALGRENCEQVINAARLAGAHTHAARLATLIRDDMDPKATALAGQAAMGSAAARRG